MAIYIRSDYAGARGQESAVKAFLRCSLRRLGLAHADVSVVLTTDAGIRKLNRDHRGIDRATDVLSFGMREQRRRTDPLPPHPEVLGDLVISLPTVRRQAKDLKRSFQSELNLMLVHALLHLLGYRHTGRAPSLRMETVQTALLAACAGK